MDKNRLIQIANHFDKIGAYTVSDEFENKFIRTAAPVDVKLYGRDPKVTSRSNTTTVSKGIDFLKNFGTKQFSLINRSPEDKINFNIDTWNFLKTWQIVFSNFKTRTEYSDPKANNIINDIFTELAIAEINFKKAKPAGVTSGAINDRTKNELLSFANDEQSLLQIFRQFVDQENEKYKGGEQTKYYTYLNNLRTAETLLYNLDMTQSQGQTIPLPTDTKPNPSGGGSTTPPKNRPIFETNPPPKPPTPAKPGQGGGGGSTTPSGGSTPSGGGSSSRPSGGGARPNSGPKPIVAPSGKPSSKTTNLSVNEELSKIVFRKVRASNRKLQDDNIFLDMRIDNKYKTYLDVYKDKSLDGSIRAAIKASSFSDEFKQKLIKRLDAKIAKAIELNKAVDPVKPEPVKPEPVKPEPVKPEPTPGPVDPNKPDPVNPAKPDADGFRCTREGLFTEIGRMDTMHNNDPDKYIRSYFGDIKRVIDCHESLRNSLSLKDNTQLDSLINILEAKYFSIITKTQFPY